MITAFRLLVALPLALLFSVVLVVAVLMWVAAVLSLKFLLGDAK